MGRAAAGPSGGENCRLQKRVACAGPLQQNAEDDENKDGGQDDIGDRPKDAFVGVLPKPFGDFFKREAHVSHDAGQVLTLAQVNDTERP
ncbi:hypothetical protein [Actibacterium sp. 188UL27-1]|uniref:hypothetical protein n=1 Tax=Actibacterium sp. 188UL27-1 TaxID=2786961 RepID=UPI001EF6FAD9|nr:hypothetical protein [Actibacterium sp. 188UL27-1]